MCLSNAISSFRIVLDGVKVTGVCVVDGWFKQPHLAPVRLIRLWSWVRLHTCGASVIKAHITTHTLTERASVMAACTICSACTILQLTIHGFITTTTCVGVTQQKPLRWRVVEIYCHIDKTQNNTFIHPSVHHVFHLFIFMCFIYCHTHSNTPSMFYFL